MDAQIPPPAEHTRPPSPQAADVAKPTQRIEGLDGLRAGSILLVLIGHGPHTAGAPSAMRPFGQTGIGGGALFLTISGFLLPPLPVCARECYVASPLRRLRILR